MIKRLFFALLFPISLFSQPALPLQVNDTLRFLALGDSYTIGQSVGATERWPVQLSDSLATRGIVTDTLRIIATTGWRTDDLLNAIQNQHLQQQHYNLVSLLIGVNNQFQGKPFSQYTTEFPALLDSAIRYAGGDTGHVFVVSIPDYAYTPFGQQSPSPSQITTELAQYNQYAKHVSDSLHVRFFNITPISQQGLQNPSYVAGDGLHPSGAQYAQWVNLMLTGISTQTRVVTGIATHANETSLSIAPNPSADYISVRLQKDGEQFHTLQLYNIVGQLVTTQTTTGQSCVVSLEGLPDGLYTLKVNSGASSFVKKVMKSGR